MFRRTCLIGPKDTLAGSGLRELHIAPFFRAVHVDDALGRPYPIVFVSVSDFAILAIDDFMAPFNAGKIDAPLIAVARRRRLLGEPAQHIPRYRDFKRPSLI